MDYQKLNHNPVKIYTAPCIVIKRKIIDEVIF